VVKTGGNKGFEETNIVFGVVGEGTWNNDLLQGWPKYTVRSSDENEAICKDSTPVLEMFRMT
jgi:hypothetical protein